MFDEKENRTKTDGIICRTKCDKENGMSIFVGKDEEIVVEVYTIEVNGIHFCWTKNGKGTKPDGVTETSDGVKSYKVFFRIPTYRDTIDFVDTGIQFSPNGDFKVSSGAVSFYRFVKLLKSWTFEDAQGEPIPANQEMVSLLNPKLAQCINADLEEQLPQ